ncbi:hypothetical protein TVAG_262120 [Trichomonas vaginalis G3]|uniref:Uncharacterized protein n=1 Tax=Trichomonas vaginalis (strain ATCC PRA-98 / G3) TaxID=412133 RepID=A2DUC4_TRIV3|nr:ankyrin repeat, SAM and basic Leucine zipper domain-containing protein 1 family [Trichomonas vaginalis G3]EAY15962.1 hypothetical protein TVAG_262120 [Trichomonas vaginalis G3]KAI5523597.1 ankyrin repeat, SAM and basic Leucine zipper domain-containing protein 1 family [Trichomonas vaginalis G3]|eukprot:XP_001328185.1 hypothetical protein [Trichomonas vaginalis G3]
MAFQTISECEIPESMHKLSTISEQLWNSFYNVKFNQVKIELLEKYQSDYLIAENIRNCCNLIKSLISIEGTFKEKIDYYLWQYRYDSRYHELKSLYSELLPLIDNNCLEEFISKVDEKFNFDDHILINYAVIKGNENILRYLMMNGAKANDETYKYAIMLGNIETINLLAESGHDFGLNINTAIQYNKNEIADWILLNYDCHNQHPELCLDSLNIKAFCYCIYNNIEYPLKKLLDMKFFDLATISINHGNKLTPSELLYFIQSKENHEINKYLFEKGIITKQSFPSCDIYQYIIEKSYSKMALLCFKYFPDLEFTNDHFKACIRYNKNYLFWKMLDNIPKEKINLQSLLDSAVNNNKSQFLLSLISKGCPVNSFITIFKENTTYNLLEYSIAYYNPDLIGFLVRNGAKLDVFDLPKSIRKSYYSAILNLLNLKEQTDSAFIIDYELFFIALLQKPNKFIFSIIGLMVKNGINLNFKNETALSLAIEYQNYSIIEALMNNFSFDEQDKKLAFIKFTNQVNFGNVTSIDHINFQDYLGRNILHYVIESDSYTGIAKLLIDLGVDVNAKTNKNETPLILAARYSRDSNLINLLIEKTTDINASDINNTSFIDYFIENNLDEKIILNMIKKEIKFDYTHVMNWAIYRKNKNVISAFRNKKMVYPTELMMHNSHQMYYAMHDVYDIYDFLEFDDYDDSDDSDDFY